jgi:hypothetical protein
MEHGVAKAKRLVGSCNSALKEETKGSKAKVQEQSSMKVGGRVR